MMLNNSIIKAAEHLRQEKGELRMNEQKEEGKQRSTELFVLSKSTFKLRKNQ